METRVGRLERGMAKLEQRVEDVFTIALTNIRDDVQELNGTVAGLRTDFEDEKRQQSDRQDAALKDSRSWRRALIIGSFTVLAALITAAAAIIAAGVT
jgi:hypothetical protein